MVFEQQVFVRREAVDSTPGFPTSAVRYSVVPCSAADLCDDAGGAGSDDDYRAVDGFRGAFAPCVRRPAFLRLISVRLAGAYRLAAFAHPVALVGVGRVADYVHDRCDDLCVGGDVFRVASLQHLPLLLPPRRFR